jgi:hypothetical protein
MTLSDDERHRVLKRKHQQLLRDWTRRKDPCIVCAEREGNERDHLPPKVLFPASIRGHEPEFFTFPVCSVCNRASSDEDFLFSVVLAFGLNQDAIKNGKEPTDPDMLALYRQALGQFQDHPDAGHRAKLLRPFVEKEPRGGRLAINAQRVPINQTLTKIVKSIYWLETGGDILERYNPGWWIRSDIDTSKYHFIEKHLKTTDSEIHWGDRFISRFTIGHPENGVGGLILCSLHFYTKRAIGKGMSWLLYASPVETKFNGASLYEHSTSLWGAPTIAPKG